MLHKHLWLVPRLLVAKEQAAVGLSPDDPPRLVLCCSLGLARLVSCCCLACSLLPPVCCLLLQILQIKVNRLEHLVQLKDLRIEDLTRHLERYKTRTKHSWVSMLTTKLPIWACSEARSNTSPSPASGSIRDCHQHRHETMFILSIWKLVVNTCLQ